MLIFPTVWRRAAAANELEKYAGDARFPRLYELLIEANEKVNLTAVTDPAGVCVLHFADSLTLLPFIPEGARVVDVGCGGGFPCLPLAIARPDLKITALDSTAKKLTFVAGAAPELGLDNVTTLAARAEDAGRDPAFRESFDCAVARAVAPLDVLCELCLPLVRPGGTMVAMKSRSADDELANAADIIPKLGGSPPDLRRLTLFFPDSDVPIPSPQAGEGTARDRPDGREGAADRAIILIPKASPTPAAFPRQYSQIKKSHDKKVKKDKQNP